MTTLRAMARRELDPPRWGALIALVTVAAVALALTGLHSAARVVATFLFFGLCPGLAFVRRLRLADVATELVISFALSLALATMLATVMAYSRIWTPNGALVVLAAFTLLAVALPVRADRSRSRGVGR
jgi:uncharacterized membrane protein